MRDIKQHNLTAHTCRHALLQARNCARSVGGVTPWPDNVRDVDDDDDDDDGDAPDDETQDSASPR